MSPGQELLPGRTSPRSPQGEARTRPRGGQSPPAGQLCIPEQPGVPGSEDLPPEPVPEPRGDALGVPRPGPPAQPALAHGDGARGDLLGTAGHPWIAAGIAAGRSRAGTRTGAPGSAARASRATARGHPALGPPPALWGRGRNVTFSVAAMDREGAASSRSAGTAVGAPRPWRSPLSPGLRGDQKGELPCKGLAGQPLWRSQEGTRELGSGARPWSQGDRARTGLALLGHSRDTCHQCHTGLQSASWQGQGARVGQEQLDKERRKITTAQEEKLELLERLRELERGSRSLLRQRLRVLHRLQGLLQRDRAQSLRLLREAMEQEPLGSSARREHRPSRAGGSAALGNPPVAPRAPGPRPGTALAPGPSSAALGRALHVLRGLRQQIQRRLGQWQGLEGALGAAGQRKEVIRGWQGGHGARDSIGPWRSRHCHRWAVPAPLRARAQPCVCPCAGGRAQPAATEGSRSPEGAPDPGEPGPGPAPRLGWGSGAGLRDQASGVGVSESLGDPQIPSRGSVPSSAW
ncbi:uncharacterized protein GJ701_012605 isoform 2-T4 [Geothlypis trichas]